MKGVSRVLRSTQRARALKQMTGIVGAMPARRTCTLWRKGRGLADDFQSSVLLLHCRHKLYRENSPGLLAIAGRQAGAWTYKISGPDLQDRALLPYC